MLSRLMLILLIAAGLLHVAALPSNGSPHQQLQQRYGEELGDPMTRLNPRPLAERMIEDVETVLDDGELDLAELILEEIYNLAGDRPGAYDIALEATTLMAEHVPARRGESLTRSASVVQRMLEEADEAEHARLTHRLAELLVDLAQLHEEQEQLRAARAFYQRAARQAREAEDFPTEAIDAGLRRIETAFKVEELEERLQEDRTDSELAERLMRLYLREMDDPESAHRLRFTADDRELREYANLANQPPERLLADECLALGAFYTRLAAEASPEAMPVMIERAEAYYQQFLDRDPRDAQQVAQVRQSIAELEDRAAELAAQADEPSLADAAADEGPADPAMDAGALADAGDAADPDADLDDDDPYAEDGDAVAPGEVGAEDGAGVDLLAGLDVSTYGYSGVWTINDDGELEGSQPTPAQVTLPIVPGGSYTFTTSFTRTSQTGSIVIHLPLGSEYRALLKLGDRRRRQRDYIAGLEMLDNQPSYNNETTVPLELETDHRYELHVEVDIDDIEVEIVATLDGEPVIDWNGFRAAFSIARVWESLEEATIGLGLDAGADATFHYARLETPQGDHELLDP